ncbi:MAG: TraB/GumN family protein [Puia sp.]|nr:TraB/GumN family protein [Puia sp.]
MSRSSVIRIFSLVSFCFLMASFSGMAQQKKEKRYQALLWEITGNGLSRPSYLFGTMHVSSKLVFHLSDSFYLDIKKTDIVALELDPQLWQDQLFRFQNLQSNLRFYTQGAPAASLNEKSFQLEKYEDRLKTALSDEPTLINGLLYRSFQSRADFEEDTYLDLYIYQTGRKLGKQATGVENYFETERLIMEAAQDMMKDKKKKAADNDGETMYDLEKKTQDAYRRGDLDMLDSLEKLMEPSEAYMEKFLYRRNEIQAHSIDSIVRLHSLFVGVGAAHLPGKRGVIELLRRKGYHLRPVSMQDRDALQKEEVDKSKVPVNFSKYTSDDGRFSVSLPGKLYRRADNRHAEDAWQYADMSNGAYYMVGRVRTHGYFFGHGEETLFKKVDSLLYENIPGKILRKTPITRNGYKGFDITNRTRRGDLQRYNILVTPYEVLIFKMSGTGNYVDGKEAEQFFGSIELLKKMGQEGAAGQNGAIGQKDANGTPVSTAVDFEPRQGGFRVRFPGAPFENDNRTNPDGIPRWEYEAFDPSDGDAFLVWKKTVQNYRYLEEDTVDLDLMEESFGLSDWIDKPLHRQMGRFSGYPCLDASFLEKDGSFIRARFLIRGPHYYLLAARSKNKDQRFSEFFDSFHFTQPRYHDFKNYVDTFVNIRVTSPIIPDIDDNARSIMERATSEEFLQSVPDYSGYWPHNKSALFEDDSTGEAVYVSMETYPKYYYPKDSLSFWNEETNEKRLNQDFIVSRKERFLFSDSVMGYKYVFSDTNTSRQIHNWIFLKDNRLFRVISLEDSLGEPSEFIGRFFGSLRPLDKRMGETIFSSKLDYFFRDFYSKDSVVSKRAKEAIPNIYFGPRGVPALLKAISSLTYNDKDYFTVKNRLINELGYISDSASVDEVVAGLKTVYDRAGDTSIFQNAVFKSLARNKTRQAYDMLKRLLLQDPPVFENSSDYSYLFQDLGDSLALARTLFPELLQLSSVDDYKDNIQSLLVSLVDSGYLKGPDYESYFNKIYFDAKIQWKKQEERDEKKLQKKGDDNEEGSWDGADKTEDADNGLDDFAVLLQPFYDKNPVVPRFFEKLLRSRDETVRLNTVVLLIRHHIPVADSIIQTLAANDQYRSLLLKKLKRVGQENKFPDKFRNQQDIARSQLVSNRKESDFFALQYVDKKLVQLHRNKGYVYFFKYKVGRDDDWQMGISGLQPFDLREVNNDNELVRLTNKKIKPDQPTLEQFDKQLKRLLVSRHKGAASFYLDNDYFGGRNEEDE